MPEILIHIISRKIAKSIGMKRYFPASTCKNGHTSERHTSNGTCTSCINERQKSHEWINYKKQYYVENKKHIDEKNKKNSELRGKEAIRIKNKEYRERNKEYINAKRKIYRDGNKKSIRGAIKKWERLNTERISVYRNKARARRSMAEGSHTSKDIKRIYDSQRGICAGCKIKIPKSGKNRYHVDHIIPLAKGGTNNPENIQILCAKCNCGKGAKDPIVWANENGRLL